MNPKEKYCNLLLVLMASRGKCLLLSDHSKSFSHEFTVSVDRFDFLFNLYDVIFVNYGFHLSPEGG